MTLNLVDTSLLLNSNNVNTAQLILLKECCPKTSSFALGVITFLNIVLKRKEPPDPFENEPRNKVQDLFT